MSVFNNEDPADPSVHEPTPERHPMADALPESFAYYCPKTGKFMSAADYSAGAHLAGPMRGNYEPVIFQEAARAAIASRDAELGKLRQGEALQPLSDEDIDATWNEREPNLEPRYKVRWFARAIERLITERMSAGGTK